MSLTHLSVGYPHSARYRSSRADPSASKSENVAAVEPELLKHHKDRGCAASRDAKRSKLDNAISHRKFQQSPPHD
jgi:hypothetical protein